MKIQMRFEGGEELARTLRALPEALTVRLVRAVLKEAAEPMRLRMARLAPHEPGAPDLRDSMTISVANRIGSTAGGRWRAREDRHEQAVAVGPSKDAFYGIFQEYGTVHHGAQPFMRPAFDAIAPESLAIIRRALWRELAARGIQAPMRHVPTPVQSPGGRL